MALPAFAASTTTKQQIHPWPPPLLDQYTPVATVKSTARVDPTASCTSVIAGHCRNGRLCEAIQEFSRMRLSGIEPNGSTFVTLLSGCAHFPSKSQSLGPSLHACAKKLGLDRSNVKVNTAIVDMYMKFGQMGLAKLIFDHMGMKNKVTWNTMLDGYMRNGCFDEAMELFDEMPQRDVVSWTAMIGGFVKKGRYLEAMEWFSEMQLSGVDPDYVAVVSVLSAIANLGMLGIGLWMHRFVLENDYKDNVRVNNSLIDMYCRCGNVELARQVFKGMWKRSLVSWNSIIVGLAVNGYAEEALEYFKLMLKDGCQPDGVSFTGALAACSHAGLLAQGLELFDVMKRVHRIVPCIEHYGCLVDLYSRAGRLEDALHVIENMPLKPNEVVLGSLLAACRASGDIILAERLMNYNFNLDPGGDSNYVLLSNIYAASGSWHGASNVRKRMKSLGIQKRPGMSTIEVDGAIHEFMACDRSHVDTESIYIMLELLSCELRNFENGEDTNPNIELYDIVHSTLSHL